MTSKGEGEERYRIEMDGNENEDFGSKVLEFGRILGVVTKGSILSV